MLKKLIVTVVVCVAVYHALKFYAWHTLSTEVVLACVGVDEMPKMKARRAPPREVEDFMRRAFGCIESKQSALQAFFFPIPDAWRNPPPGSVTYESLPDL